MTPGEFNITADWIEAKGVAVLALEGHLDAHTFESLEKTVEEHFALKHYRIVIDLSRLEYVSSAGCGQFIAAVSDADAKGGLVVFVNPSESVAAALQIIGILDMLPTADSVGSAMAMFK